MTKIAVLGTGRMGTAIARRLLSSGHAITVWNRDQTRTASLVVAGAEPAASPADAVRGADVVITMLTDAAAVNAVLFAEPDADPDEAAYDADPDEAAPDVMPDDAAPGSAVVALRPGTTLVQMSTIGPAEVRDLARRLPEGVNLVDAPVAGSVGAAEAGELIVLAGGNASAVDRVSPGLAELGTLRRCGEIGAGSALKLVLNTALVTAVASLADVLAVADGVGVDRRVALDALATGPLGGAIRRATATGASFAIALAAKDLQLARRELRTPAPVADAVARVLGDVTDPSADIAALIANNTHEGQ